MSSAEATARVRLKSKIACPHCWEYFAPKDALWVAEHSDLEGDLRLGEQAQERFLPSRFTVNGQAIDTRGLPCSELACPHCHLVAPRAIFEFPTCFWSILGTPASGKSYYLAAMTHSLRQRLPRYFESTFSDVDPQSNQILKDYESLLFHGANQAELIAIRKTERQGAMYSQVRYDDRTVSYPTPFLFTARALPDHPAFNNKGRNGQVICLYDNAGEHFLPGQDSADSPATRHMAHSQSLFFVFDPMQSTKFLAQCKKISQDPQLHSKNIISDQEAVLTEAANRVRRFTGLPEHQQHDKPLIIILNKFDVWAPLLNRGDLPSPFVTSPSGQTALNYGVLLKVSDILKEFLARRVPELVAIAKGFAKKVYFFPVSSTGCSPEIVPETGKLGIRAENINPIWADVPMLFALSQFTNAKLISTYNKEPDDSFWNECSGGFQVNPIHPPKTGSNNGKSSNGEPASPPTQSGPPGPTPFVPPAPSPFVPPSVEKRLASYPPAPAPGASLNSPPAPAPMTSIQRPAAPAPRQMARLHEASLQAGTVTTNRIGMQLCFIPEGEFLMGSPMDELDRASGEGPQHRVQMNQGYCLGVHPVTVGQFRKFVQDTQFQSEAESNGGGWGYSNGSFQGPDQKYSWNSVGWMQSSTHPVVNVTWNDAVAFCKWLSDLEGKECRLPTEAEWEYACRAGTTSPFSCGPTLQSTHANFNGTQPYSVAARSPFLGRSTSVGEYSPNAWGVYDIHGNVWEWCFDGERTYSNTVAVSPSGSTDATSTKILRGGSWSDKALNCRSAARFSSDASNRSCNTGFRVVQTT